MNNRYPPKARTPNPAIMKKLGTNITLVTTNVGLILVYKNRAVNMPIIKITPEDRRINAVLRPVLDPASP
jgi:hypothetical protein